MTAKTETATGNTWSYTYDIRNRMTGVTQKNSGGSVIYQAAYTYDALDRKIATNGSSSQGIQANDVYHNNTHPESS